MIISSIVEGHGEVRALPILLRRLQEWKSPLATLEIIEPIRVSRDRFLRREDEFERYVRLAAAKSGIDGWILVLLDADDDCPFEMGPKFATKIKLYAPNHRVSVILANREYESWFIASASSLNGQRGFFHKNPNPENSDLIRDAKGWMKTRIASRSYGETTDQPAFTARMDLMLTKKNSRSFRKLCDEWDRNSPPDESISQSFI